MKKEGQLTALMREMGSKSGEFTAEPPDQWLWQLYNGRTPLDRLLAYLKQNSTARTPPTAWAVDNSGKPIRVPNIAEALDVSLKHAANTVVDGIQLGLIRRQKDARGVTIQDGPIGLCGDVPDVKSDKRRTKSERESPVQGTYVRFSFAFGDITDQISHFDEHRRIAFNQAAEDFEAWSRKLEAAAMAEARRIADEVKYNLLTGIGVKLPPKQVPLVPKDRGVQLTLMLEPPTLPSIFVSPVQGNGNGKPTPLVQPGNGTCTGEAYIRKTESEEIFKKEKPVSQQGQADGQAGRLSSDERINQLQTLLVKTLRSKIPDEFPGQPLCVRVLATLGSASLDSLERLILARYSYIQSYGMVIALARDAAALATAPPGDPVQPKPTLSSADLRAQRFAEEYNARQKAKEQINGHRKSV